LKQELTAILRKGDKPHFVKYDEIQFAESSP
jgi:hypothetical protein